MILVDANLLIFAYEARTPAHAAARTWLDAQLNGAAPVGLPWPALLAYLRITTNPRIFPRAQTMQRAWKQVEAWLGAEPAWIPQPTPRHVEILGHLLTGARTTRDLTSDAHLAALAIEHGLTLCSPDSDFARFQGLRWIDPLQT